MNVANAMMMDTYRIVAIDINMNYSNAITLVASARFAKIADMP